MNQIKYTLALLLIFLSLQGSAQNYSKEAKEYFFEIAFGNEFEKGAPAEIKKWNDDIKISVLGFKQDYLELELDHIISELNSLLKNIVDKSPVHFFNAPQKIIEKVRGEVQLERVAQSREANFIILFGSGDDYVSQLQPAAKELVKSNRGLFRIYTTLDNVIYKATMYVDTELVKDQATAKHILREELTQALGLMNDSYHYPESIFYQGWTSVTQYTEIDKELIKILYDPAIKPKMSIEEVKKILDKK